MDAKELVAPLQLEEMARLTFALVALRLRKASHTGPNAFPEETEQEIKKLESELEALRRFWPDQGVIVKRRVANTINLN